MAKDGESSTPANKGKAKAPESGGRKVDDVKKDKNGKPILNGKKDDEPREGIQLRLREQSAYANEVNFYRRA